jgi:hypothetical protein
MKYNDWDKPRLQGLALAALMKVHWPHLKPIGVDKPFATDDQWRAWLRVASRESLLSVLKILQVTVPAWEYGKIAVGWKPPAKKTYRARRDGA